MPVTTTLHLCRAPPSSSPCTLAGCRPACASSSRSRCSTAHLRASPSEPLAWGEEAPGTGQRHFPEQAVDMPPEEDPQRQGNFEMRSTAEVYELFERLQYQHINAGQRSGSGGDAGGAVDFREAAAEGGPALGQPEESLRTGPLTGRRRRPGVVSSMEADEDSTRGFEMRSAAEVAAMFEAWQQRNVAGEPLPVEVAEHGDCHAG